MIQKRSLLCMHRVSWSFTKTLSHFNLLMDLLTVEIYVEAAAQLCGKGSRLTD